jgi:hypothetical protein
MNECNRVPRRKGGEDSHLAGGALVGSGAENWASRLVLADEAGGAPRLGQTKDERSLEVKGGLDRRLKRGGRGEEGRNGEGLGGRSYVRERGEGGGILKEKVREVGMVREGEERGGEGRGEQRGEESRR